MQVSRGTFRILQIILLLVVLGLVGLVTLFLLNNVSSNPLKDTSYEANTLRLQTSAFAYNRRLMEYTGVCSDIGVPEQYVCKENISQFVIYTQLSTGLFYCTDSSGFIGEVSAVSTESISCQ